MAHIIINKTLLCSFLGGMISVSSLAQNLGMTGNSSGNLQGGIQGKNPENLQENHQENNQTMASAKIYTLEQCVSEAVSNNLKLRNADKQILMSEEQRKEAFTKYFPTVSAMGLGYMADKGLVQMDLGGGMAMSLLKHGYNASVTALQPVFAGGQIVNGNKLAKVGADVSRLQRGLTENEIRLNTENYYWQAVMLKEKLKTIDQVEKQLIEVRKDAQAAVDAGIRNRNDLLQVKLRHNETRTSRIQVENALQTVCDLLAQVMGHAGENIDVCELMEVSKVSLSAKYNKESSEKISSTKGLADSNKVLADNYKEASNSDKGSLSILPDSPQQLFVSPETALHQTNEYQLLDKQVEADQLQYKLSVGKNLPSVAIGGGYIYNHLMDKSQNNLVGMLTVSVPISSWWGGSHDMKRQKLQIANAIDDKQNQSEQLIIRMRKAWNDLNDAYKQVAIARESIEQSEENLRLNTDYYQAGTSTISDVLDAQTLYQQSRDQYVESIAKYEVKKREYLQATGR